MEHPDLALALCLLDFQLGPSYTSLRIWLFIPFSLLCSIFFLLFTFEFSLYLEPNLNSFVHFLQFKDCFISVESHAHWQSSGTAVSSGCGYFMQVIHVHGYDWNGHGKTHVSTNLYSFYFKYKFGIACYSLCLICVGYQYWTLIDIWLISNFEAFFKVASIVGVDSRV